jgi:dTDP-4-dehydrorhamnose reductase
MARVAIVGSNGQLGSDCLEEFAGAGHEVLGLDHGALEIADGGAVDLVLGEIRPQVVVNTAAMHNVEGCEVEPVRAFEVNGVGSRNLARAARKLGFRLLHVSTDYVFDGSLRRPYTEDDLPLPLNVYGNSKLSGEYFILAEAADAVVVRTSGLYGRAPCRAKRGGRNFVQRMLELARQRGWVEVVKDEFVTPTYTLDLARQLVLLAEKPLRGLVHATSQGECSWYDFAGAIFEISQVPVDLRATTSAVFPANVSRPGYSVLDNRRLREEGLDRMPHWRDALRSYLEAIGEARRPARTLATEPR